MNTRQPDGEAHDPIDAAWHAASTDLPPADVDATILAAASAAVRVRPLPSSTPARRPWHQRWQPLAAAAGVAGLAFVLVQMLPRDPAPQAGRATGTAAPVAPPAAAEKSAEALTPREPEPSAADTALATAVPDDTATAVAPPRPPPSRAPAAPAAPAATEFAPDPALPTSSVAESVAPEPASVEPPAARLPGAAAKASSRADNAVAGAASVGALGDSSPPPDAEVQRIVDLHRRGELAAAADALRELRARDPQADQQLPDSLRAWAQTVR